jgi:hypothetical protein
MFPNGPRALLLALLDTLQTTLSRSSGGARSNEDALAILLPFVGRLACITPGDISAHTKKGGICVFRGWEDDFAAYLSRLEATLIARAMRAKCKDHIITLGDATTYSFPHKRFRSIMTSPPYPNHRDFASMFSPENCFLQILAELGQFALSTDPHAIVGSNFVAGKTPARSVSRTAHKFFVQLSSLKRSKRAQYDDDVYYVPYLQQYFADLEALFENVETALANRAQGYIIVVNNTHRGLTIPVAQFVAERWRHLGFQVAFAREVESFHVGSKNPRAKGSRAKHKEYAIRIART